MSFATSLYRIVALTTALIFATRMEHAARAAAALGAVRPITARAIGFGLGAMIGLLGTHALAIAIQLAIALALALAWCALALARVAPAHRRTLARALRRTLAPS